MKRVIQWVRSRLAGPAGQMTTEQAMRRFDAMMAHGEEGRIISPKESFTRSAWVYGAVSIIAEAVSRTPFIITIGDDAQQRVRTGPIVDLITNPNGYDNQNTSAKFRNAYMIELLLNGAVMKVFTEIKGQQPLEMTIFPRSRFRAETIFDKNGREVVRRWFQTGGRSGNRYVPGDEIYHDSLYNPLHDWEGLAPLSAALAVVANDVNISEYANRYFTNDASPGVVFSSDDPQFDNVRAAEATKLYNEKHRGVGKAWKAVFLGNGLRPYKVGMGLDARILGALKGLTREEIVTGIFKVPLSIFGQSDIAGNAGVVIGGRNAASESEKEGFIINVIIPWARRFDEEFNKDIAWRFDERFRGLHDFGENPILENRRLARAQTAAELLKHGVSLNEITRWLRLEISEMPWGDEWLVPDNMIPASVLVKAGDKLLEQRDEKKKGPKGQLAGLDELEDPSLGQHRTGAITEHVEKIVTAAEERLRSGLHEHEARVRQILAEAGRIPPAGSKGENGQHKNRLAEALQ